MKTRSLAVLLSLTLPVAASAADLGKRLDAEVATSGGKKTQQKPATVPASEAVALNGEVR